VLGKEFTIEALKHISPLKKDLRHDKKVEDSIKLLASRDLLEVIDERGDGNFTSRLSRAFLRNTAYQMLRYKPTKKELHLATEQFVQQSPMALTRQENELHVDILLLHMLRA